MKLIQFDSVFQTEEVFKAPLQSVKAIAWYLPQFHQIPENDKFWGEGFTEWTNCRNTKPKNVGHYQPRLPHADIGYYDLSDWHVLQKQAEMAKRHGIYGFCFYRYWFDGHELLQKPLELLLEHKEIDLNYCLCWANENWTKKWNGGDNAVLLQQTYTNDSIDYIVGIKKWLEDPRYIRIDNKPLVVVYRPHLLPDAAKTFRLWREYAQNNGIGELFIAVVRWGGWKSAESAIVDGADAEIEFPPSATAPTTRNDYEQLVNNIIAGNSYVEKFKHTVFRGVMLDFDNSSRGGCYPWLNFSILDYYRWLRYAIEWTTSHNAQSQQFLFINAWNEWAEGTYLEPDQKYGYTAINTTSKALFNIPLKISCIDGRNIEVTTSGEIKYKKWYNRKISQYLFPYTLYDIFYPKANQHLGKLYSKWSEENTIELMRKFNALKQTTDKFMHFKQIELDKLNAPDSLETHKKIAVQLHLFHLQLLPEFIRYLSNIPYKFDLYVSIQQYQFIDVEDFECMFKTCLANVQHCEVKQVENVGQDVFPFIVVYGEKLLQYDIVLKIHSKYGTIENGSFEFEKEFRRNNLDFLLKSTKHVKAIINQLSYHNVGIIIPQYYNACYNYTSNYGIYYNICQNVMCQFLKRKIILSLHYPVCHFPEGNMFWATTDYLRALMLFAKQNFKLNLTYEQYKMQKFKTYMHVVERMWCIFGSQTTDKTCIQLVGSTANCGVEKKIASSNLSNKTAIVAIQCDEPNLAEWCYYHLKIADELFIFCNNCKKPVPHELMQNIRLHFIDFPDDNERCLPTQHSAYNQFLDENYDKFRAAAFIDLDEYIVTHGKTLAEVMDMHADCNALSLNWVFFGSQQEVEVKDDTSTLARRFLHSERNANIYCKTVVNMRKLDSRYVGFMLNPHYINMRQTKHYIVQESAAYTCVRGPCSKVKIDLAEQPYIAHYYSKTLSEFMHKIARGAPDRNGQMHKKQLPPQYKDMADTLLKYRSQNDKNEILNTDVFHALMP